MQLVREISCKVNFVSGAFMSVMSFFNTAPTSTILFLNLLWCRFIGFLFIFLILFLNEFFLLFERFRRFLDLLSVLFLGLNFFFFLGLSGQQPNLLGKYIWALHPNFFSSFRSLFRLNAFSHSYANVILANSTHDPNVSIHLGMYATFSLQLFLA